jgi:uncharacterized protein (TIGR02145 family)
LVQGSGDVVNSKVMSLLIGVLVVSSVNAQVLKVWKNDSATNFNVSTQVDSIAFKSDSLKLFGVGSDVSYGVNGDLDSVTFAEGVHYGSMRDERDGKVYKTVKIGEQTWMAENLNFGEYLEARPSNSNEGIQYQLNGQKFCYGNDSLNCSSLGGLYQWHTVMGLGEGCGDGSKSCDDQIENGTHQGVCPGGWHVAKKFEWEVLKTLLDVNWDAGEKMKIIDFKGSNISGFSAPAGGYRSEGGGFISHGVNAYFWEAAEDLASNAYYCSLARDYEALSNGVMVKERSFSVRCLRDEK